MSPIIARGKEFHKKTNLIFGILFALLTLYGYILLSSSQTHMPLVVIIDILIPVLLLAIIPRLFKASWKPLFQFAAGFAHALFVLQLYAILIGALKIIGGF